ncbi:hypothetical protein PRIPAC_96346 [Pristionchus pacificus]|uniref:G protein-coupled receptor n=1 Tax=Pristionchus pacificus TaxID=54126 RepID=A0A2A6D1Z4_PRIPA|nr:hypothetical protein PRIPAC_96346 [Pristionchus pacificus]|eukprot:PDM84327.1 G protein-coupled receptor [Pristionchus pacificus]
MINIGIVSRVLSVISIFGIAANSAAMYFVYRYKWVKYNTRTKYSPIRHLHNTFGAFCAVLAISNFGILLTFLVWCSYGNLIFDEDSLTGKTAKVVGHITLYLLDMKAYAHLGVSINRLISLKYPFKYYSMESKSLITVVYIDEDCFFMYFKEIAVWSYGETPCNDFYSLLAYFLLFCFISSYLFPQLRRFCSNCFHYVLNNCSGFHFSSHIAEGGKSICFHTKQVHQVHEFSQSNDQMRIKRKSEIGFFVQSLCQMVPLIFGYIF